MSWLDAFGAEIKVGTLVTYAMKRDGGMLYPVARVVGEAPTGWLFVEFEPMWLAKENAPYQKLLDDAKKNPNCLVSLDVLEGNIIKATKRKVASMSLIRLDTHPTFSGL